MKKTMIPSIATAFSTGTEARAKAQFRNVHPPQPKGWGYKESAVIEENQSASYKGGDYKKVHHQIICTNGMEIYLRNAMASYRRQPPQMMPF